MKEKDTRIEIVKEMWDCFNKIYFSNTLPHSRKIKFIIKPSKSNYGTCNYENKTITISSTYHVSKNGKLQRRWTETLLHEMLHFYDRETSNLSPNNRPHRNGFYDREKKLLKFRFPVEQLNETYPK